MTRAFHRRERAIERERELGSVRMRECSERFDQQLQAQRIRLAQDMAQERERLEATHRSERQRIEEMYGMQVRYVVRGAQREVGGVWLLWTGCK